MLQTRKRLPIGIVTSLSALALAGCTQSEDRAPTKSEAPVTAPAPPPTSQPAPPSDSAQPVPGATTPAPVPLADECGASKLGDYLNQLASADITTKIEQTVGHARIRTIKPGDAVTMDFRPDRLNVEIGADGRITRLRCG